MTDEQKPALFVNADALRFLLAGSLRARCTTEMRRVADDGDVPLYTQAAIDAAGAAERERVAQWVRDNYQDHPNIDSLCAAIRQAPAGEKT